jgi:excisionase family DNA binding protein
MTANRLQIMKIHEDGQPSSLASLVAPSMGKRFSGPIPPKMANPAMLRTPWPPIARCASAVTSRVKVPAPCAIRAWTVARDGPADHPGRGGTGGDLGIPARPRARTAGIPLPELTACRTDPPGRFLTVEEAAEIIRAPVSFIYNARSDGRLTPHKRGSRALVDRAELEGLIRT